ncbi:MAG: S8 family serine peptidase [Oligoflexia bacterium]|nr:S8 family serine peptidase [Oligoflexia bacterium]
MNGFKAVCLILIWSFVSTPSWAGSNKIGVQLSKILRKARGPVNALIIMREQTKFEDIDYRLSKEVRGRIVYDRLRQRAMASQTSLITYLEAEKISYKQFHIINAIAVERVFPAQLEALSMREDVGKIVADPPFSRPPLPGVPFPSDDPIGIKTFDFNQSIAAGPGENIRFTQADRVWKELGVRGRGIVIGAQDTGYQFNHPALVEKYRGNLGGQFDHRYAWHDSIRKPVNNKPNKCGYNLKAPCDDDQHGTHTLGTILGGDENLPIGMAPEAQWIGCRNMDGGVGRPSTYIECFEFFLAPYPQGGNALTQGKPELAPHILNNSWGCPKDEGCEGWEMMPVMEALNAAGIMVVVSAGNEGPGCSTISSQPAHFSLLTLTVGALDHRNGKIASFSSRGPSAFDGGLGPHVTAPGVRVYSSIPGNGYSENGWSGTSMAGPHVVGQIALMWSANPKLIGNTAISAELVRKTAAPKVSTENCGSTTAATVPNNAYGFGSIDALASVKAALLN